MAAATPSSGSTNDAAASPSPALARLQATLNRLYRLTIADGRSFTGTLVCLDKELNLILSNTTEVNPAGDDRDVGMVMVPWRWVVDAHVESDDRPSWTDRFTGAGAGSSSASGPEIVYGDRASLNGDAGEAALYI